jgi:Holliday junction DNA helicase RuvA
MIAYLSGKIIIEKPGFIILETGGVGYKVFTDESKVQSPQSKAVELFTYQNIREDTNDLYGFATFEELELFEKLISVNGVGPKAGMLVMASAPADKIISSILSEDLTFFKAISGIGNKVAAKIILDLKSKISGEDGSGVISQSGRSDDVIDALVSLGYKQVEIQRALTKIPPDIETPEDKIRWCLKNLTRG